jgi:hypothetical protein
MAPQAFEATKNNPEVSLVANTSGIRKAFRKGAWQVIATRTMKTINDSNQASSLSHPANRLRRSLSCTPTLALGAAQRSY